MEMVIDKDNTQIGEYLGAVLSIFVIGHKIFCVCSCFKTIETNKKFIY